MTTNGEGLNGEGLNNESPGRAGTTRLFWIYRALALVVGVLLLVGTVGSVLKYGHYVVGFAGLEDGSSLQQFGDDLTPIWLIHGWIYMVYVAVAFVLTQKARWTMGQFLLMLVAGLVPGLIFWVERRVAERLRADTAALARA